MYLGDKMLEFDITYVHLTALNDHVIEVGSKVELQLRRLDKDIRYEHSILFQLPYITVYKPPF